MAEQKKDVILIDQVINDGITKDFDALVKMLMTDPVDREIETWIDEYEGKHVILQRPDKIVGEGEDSKTVIVNKIPILFQKKIVNSAVAFLLGVPVDLILNNAEDKFKEAFAAIKKVYKDNKIHSFDKKLARWFFIETKVAELWYAYIPEGDAKEEKRYRVKLLCKNNGDEINAHFDAFGDMDAFIRKYNTLDSEGKEVPNVDIYTAKTNYHAIKAGDAWEFTEEANLFEKIPVIYYSRETPEWSDVQEAIERIEMLISRHADTNDYYGDPSLKLWGDVEDPPSKGDVGKVLQFTASINPDVKQDAEYLEWNSSPESLKLEYEHLKDIIYSMTDTPDLSFNNVKGFGNLSGITIKLLFFGAMLKANMNQEVIGEGFRRRLNLIKTMLLKTNVSGGAAIEELDISIKFNNPLPENINETIEALSIARGGEPTISQKTAVRRNPLVEDPEGEIEELEKEQAGKNQLGETFNIT